jgi:thioester reductase-like protein
MKSVLLTGGTGVIGSALVPLLLEERDTTVRLLLRADSEEHLGERLGRLFAFWHLEPAGPLARRIRAYRGDVSAPQLGLANGDYTQLAGEVTHVIHSAGNVRLNRPLSEARRDAVDAAVHIVALARKCQSEGRLAKLEFVSTVGVAGRSRGLVPEQPLCEVREFHNTYEAAKAEAEALLLREIRTGLRATIYRPSMVVGDSRTGTTIHFQVFYYLAEFLAGSRTCGLVPETGAVRLDIVPVDYVAEAICRGSERPDACGRIFHLCSGAVSSPPLTELTKLIREQFRAHGRSLPQLRVLPRGVFKALAVLGGRAPGKTARALRTLPYFLAYLEEGQTFQDEATRAFFAQSGPRLRCVEDYLPRVMQYYLAARTGAAAEAKLAGAGV